MFGLAQTFQKPLLVSKLADPAGSRPLDPGYFSQQRNLSPTSTLGCSSISNQASVWHFPEQGLDDTAAAVVPPNRPSRRSSVIQQVKSSLSFLLPDTFMSASSATLRNPQVPLSSLYHTEYVFVRADNEPMVEGPYKVLQRNQCLFKLDLGDHHKWISIEKLEPTTLDLSPSSLPPTDETLGEEEEEEEKDKRTKQNWMRRNIRNRMSMPNRMRQSIRRFNFVRRNSQIDTEVLRLEKG